MTRRRLLSCCGALLVLIVAAVATVEFGGHHRTSAASLPQETRSRTDAMHAAAEGRATAAEPIAEQVPVEATRHAYAVLPAGTSAVAANDIFNLKVAAGDADTVAVLVDVMRDTHRPVTIRNYAAQHLGTWAQGHRSPEAVAALVDASGPSGDGAIRDIAIFSLARAGLSTSASAGFAAADARRAVAAALDEKNPVAIRAAAARAAQYTMTADIAHVLETIAADGRQPVGVRAAAFDVLANSGNEAISEIARRALPGLRATNASMPLVLACERAAASDRTSTTSTRTNL